MGIRDQAKHVGTSPPRKAPDATDLQDSIPRVRRRTPSVDSTERRKRRRGDTVRSPSSGDSPRGSRYPDAEPSVPRVHRRQTPPKPPAPYARGPPPPQKHVYGNGAYGSHQPYAGAAYLRAVIPPQTTQQINKSRRLYVGNIPFHVGLSDMALTQFFSALYVAGFRPNKPGEPLPVISVWLHSDGKFGFMELRGDQEAVNMMQLNGVFLHSRPLRINRPSDYRPEIHNPAAINLVAEAINIPAIVELCNQLGGLASPPAHLLAVAAANVAKEQEEMERLDRLGVSQNGSAPDVAKFALSAKLETAIQPPANGNGIVQKPAAPQRPLNNFNFRSQPPPVNPEKTVADGENGVSKSVPKAGVKKVEEPEPMAVEKQLPKEDSADDVKKEAAQSSPSPIDGEIELAKTAGKVISLVNLVTNEDLDGSEEDFEDLVDDVKTECSQYGVVKAVEIPRSGEWKGTAFIEFSRAEDANTAVSALRTRVFDGRQISAEIVKGCISALSASSRITADK